MQPGKLQARMCKLTLQVIEAPHFGFATVCPAVIKSAATAAFPGGLFQAMIQSAASAASPPAKNRQKTFKISKIIRNHWRVYTESENP